MRNGESVLRSWLIYSKVKNSLFCYCCRLFAVHSNDRKQMTTGAFLSIDGFNTCWIQRLKITKQNSEHLTSFDEWKQLAIRLKLGRTTNTSFHSHVREEEKQWKDILRWIFDVIAFLSKQNLSFRGHREYLRKWD